MVIVDTADYIIICNERHGGGFCRITDIKSKSDEELELLASCGVNDVPIGSESGRDEKLDFIRKGFKSSDIIEQAERLHGAGKISPSSTLQTLQER